MTAKILFLRSAILFLLTVSPLSSHAISHKEQVRCAQIFSDVLDSGRRIREAALRIQNFEAQAYRALPFTSERYSYLEEKNPGISFNELIDEKIRNAPRIAAALVDLVHRQFASISPSVHVSIFLSGEVAERWATEIRPELEVYFSNFDILTLPGKISLSLNDSRRPIPDFSSFERKYIKGGLNLLLDDSYADGGTVRALREKLNAIGSDLHGVFVAYEGGRGDPFSLYKSSRPDLHVHSLGNFTVSPYRWELNPNLAKLSPRSLIMGIETRGLVNNLDSKKRTAAWIRLQNVLSKKPELKLVPVDEQWDFLSNPLDVLITHSHQATGTPIEISLTGAIGDVKRKGVFAETDLSENFFLDLLVKNGILVPIFAPDIF